MFFVNLMEIVLVEIAKDSFISPEQHNHPEVRRKLTSAFTSPLKVLVGLWSQGPSGRGCGEVCLA